MNNDVRNSDGSFIGFRCFTCGGVFPSMWGTTCNKCSNKNEENRKMREEIARLTKALNDLKSK